MKKNEAQIRAMIREAIKKALEEIEDVDEVSTSGGAGGFMSPNAFSGGRASDKEKAKKNYDNSGYSVLQRPEEKDFDKPITLSEKSDQPITKNIIDRIKNHQAVSQREFAPKTKNNPNPLETDESKDDHQDAEEAHTNQDTGTKGPGYLKASKKGKANLPEHSIQKNIVLALQEINTQIAIIKQNLNESKSLREGLDLKETALWQRTKKQLTKTEAYLLNAARTIMELKNGR
jgi:hypothetical protein